MSQSAHRLHLFVSEVECHDAKKSLFLVVGHTLFEDPGVSWVEVMIRELIAQRQTHSIVFPLSL